MWTRLSYALIWLTPALLPLPVWKLRTLARHFKPAELAYRIRQKIGGFYIGQSAQFKDKPLFPHGYNGIHISGGASIGSRCVIFQQVTIGSDSLVDSKRFGSPRIGDACYIGAGARIIGSVSIGDNCRIGANAVVHRDVPDNCTVVSGGGMRVIQHDFPLDNRMINWGGSSYQYWNGSRWIPMPTAPEH